MPTWLRWQSLVDFAALAAALYFLLKWAKDARALRVVFVVLGLHASARIARKFDLDVTGWILDIATVLLIAMLMFFFQPEFRHAFLRLDSMLRLGLRPARALETGNSSVARAAFEMATDRTGALMVIGRKDPLGESVSGGVQLGGVITPELLVAIFRKESPIHDGAVLIEGSRITRAGVVLPLTQRAAVPPQYGTRHRAAMGMVERSDALVVVVSEERGEVTVMHGLHILPVGDEAALESLLQQLTARPSASLKVRARRWLLQDARLKLAACSLAVVLWGMSVVGTGGTVRLVSVPVEFYGVPSGMEISTQSTTRLQVQLRSTSWLIGSIGLTGLVARFDLANARKGALTLKVGPENLNLPPGVVVERVQPEALTVRLTEHSPPAAPSK